MKIGKNLGIIASLACSIILLTIYGCGKPEPEEIQITPEQTTIMPNETVQFSATALTKDGERVAEAEIIWRVEGDAGDVDTGGRFTAAKAGEATVIAQTGEIIGRARVTVKEPPPVLGSVVIEPAEQTIAVGEEIAFQAKALSTKSQEMADVAVSFQSTGEAGTLSESGEFTAVKPGEATVTAKAGQFTAEAQVTVTPPRLTGITADPDKEKALPGSVIRVALRGMAESGAPAAYASVSAATPTAGTALSADAIDLDPSGAGALTLTLPNQPGPVTLTLSGDGVTETLRLEATEITKLTIEPGIGPYEAGQEVAFKAVGHDDYGNQQPVDAAWSLTDDAISTLKEGGVLHLNQPGKGILLATYKKITEARPFTVIPGKLTKIVVSPESADLQAGQNVTFTAAPFNAHGFPLLSEIQWKVDGDVGTISRDAFFQAKKVGTGAVVAYAADISAQAAITVTHGPLADIAIQIPKKTITAGETIALKAEGIDTYGNRFPVDVVWFLSRSVGLIDKEAGSFTARHTGKSEIRAMVDNIVQSEEIEVVPAKLVRLEMVAPNNNLIAGDTVQFAVRGFDAYENSIEITPTFSIADDLGTLSDTGEFVAERAGNTTVTAAAGDLTAQTPLSVAPAEMVKVGIEPAGTAALTAGENRQFTAHGYDRFGNVVTSDTTWQVFPGLGEINQKGNFFAKKAGKGKIIATIRQIRTGESMEAEIPLMVNPGRTARISLEPAELTIEAGTEAQFTATPYDEFENETGAEITWSLVNPELGLLSEDGAFEARKALTGQVKASAEGVFALASVTVKPSLITFLKIVPERIATKAGASVQLNAVGEDRFGNTLQPSVTWSLSNPELAEITPEGLCRGQKAGEGMVMATSRNLVDVAPLTVETNELTAINIDPERRTIPAGSTLRFSATGFDAGGNPLDVDLAWSVSPDLGTVESDGLFTATTVGSGKVTVSANDVTGSAAITVIPGPPSAIQVDPEAITIAAGERQKISVVVRDAHDNIVPDPAYRWEITGALGRMLPPDTFLAEKEGTGRLKVVAGDAATTLPLTVQVGPLFTIDVTPRAVEMDAGSDTAFQAVGYDAYRNVVEIEPEWGVSQGLGVFAEPGHFTARKAATGFVTAQVGDVVGTAALTIHPGPVDRVMVSPRDLEVAAGKEATFSAVAYDADGNVVPSDFTWSLTPPDSGNIDDHGLFQAVKAGQTAAIAETDGVPGKASVLVTPGPLAEIVLSPARIDLIAGEMADLEITGLDRFGNRKRVDLSFEITPNSLGDMIDWNRFKAGKAGEGELTVRSGDVAASAAISVKPGALVLIEIRKPEGPLKAGKIHPFSAVGYDGAGNVVPLKAQWGVTPEIGEVEPETGRFSAQKVGDGVITAYAGNVVGHLAIHVQAGDLNGLFINPNPLTLQSNLDQTFTLEGVDVEENPVPVSVSAAVWNVAGSIGEMREPGVFHATKAGKGKVTAAVGDLMAETYVTVIPGRPNVDNSRVRVTHPILPADGTSFSEIIIVVRDTYNNPVPGVQPRIISTRTSDTLIQPPETDSSGSTRAKIQSTEPGVSILSALLGSEAFKDTAEVTFK